MKIIDAHLHFSDFPGFTETAANAGHVNNAAHLDQVFAENQIVLAVAMGAGRGRQADGECLPMTVNLNGAFCPQPYNQSPAIAYCAGLESGEITAENTPQSLAAFEALLQTPECVGLKFYMGYNAVYLNDPRHSPYFELAEAYNVPIVIHTGDTASRDGLLKYSHPLTIDEAAVNFPRVRFVMAHYGNPWIVDATAVAAKNPNVFIDLSGLAVGNFQPETFCREYSGYLEMIRSWIQYLGDDRKLLYGSDWPLVNIPAYIEVIKSLIAPQYWNNVFFENALHVFPKLRSLLK